MIRKFPITKGVLDDPLGNYPSPKCIGNVICTKYRRTAQ